MAFFDQFYEETPVQKLLNKGEELTLEELLDCENLLQEIKTHNDQALAFFTRQETVQKMFGYIFNENLSADPSVVRYAFLSCELFACETDSLFKFIASEDVLMQELMDVLKRPAPLLPRIVMPFIRTFRTIVQQQPMLATEFLRRTDQVTAFFPHLQSNEMGTIVLKLLEAHDEDENLTFQRWWLEHGLLEELQRCVGPTAASTEVRVH
eukprot:RCo007995